MVEKAATAIDAREMEAWAEGSAIAACLFPKFNRI